MVLLGVTGFGQLLGLPSALACVGLIVYLLVAPRPPDENRARVAISRVFLQVTLAFAAIWFWMNVALPLTAWGFFIGDNSHWFYDYSPHIAAAIALLASLAAFLRTTMGTASRRYFRVLVWFPPLLLVAAAAVVVEEVLSRVEGLTAECAAEHILRNHVPRTNASMRLEPHSGPPIFPDMPRDHRTYWIVDGREKVGLIMVWPNRLLGWQHLRTHRFSESTDILIEAQVYLQQGDAKNARYCLEQVIRNLPGTPAEQEARRLLATLKPR